MTQVTATKSTLKLSTVLRRNVLWIVFGSAIGGVIFYSLAMLISLTIIVNMKIDSFQNFVLVVKIFQFIPMIGLIIGGVVGGYIEMKKTSLKKLKNASTSIVLWFIVIFGMLGLEIGFLFSGITLLDLGGVDLFVWFLAGQAFDLLRNISFALRLSNTATGIELWVISVVAAIIGVVIGALIGFLIVRLRLAINKS